MNKRPRLRAVLAFLLLCLSSVAVAVPAWAEPAPLSIEPTFIGGSTNYANAPTIQFNSTGGFYGVFNASSGGIEQIRGRLAWPAGPSAHYFKIDLPKGKVLKAVVNTLSPSYFNDANGVQRITPNFQIFVYTGIPSVATGIDWNTVSIVGGFTTFSELPTQEVNILTPVGGGVPATYYLNVSIWYGNGDYTLTVTVTDPTDIGAGTQDHVGTLTAELDDTHWFRLYATHDTFATTFEEVSGWLRVDNWNAANPFQVDAIIRVFAEDLGYTPDNPIGRPIEKSEAPNRQTEPISILAPYTGYYYIMLRTQNYTNVQYTLHTNITPIQRFPAGNVYNIHKERDTDDTDWYWFNMTKASGTGQNDRVIFNMSEQSDDPLRPVNLNLWLFGYRDYYRPSGAGGVNDFDILNSSFQGDAPYNLSLNPEPRYEEVAAQAMYTGVYFLEVEDFNNSGNYTLLQRMDTAPHPARDYNNEPSQADVIDWGVQTNVTISQSEDHTDFYRITARAGETLEIYCEMPNRNAPDGRITNQTMGLVWVGIYQAGMTLLAQGWNYWYDFLNTTDHLENYTRVRATVAVDGDYIVEVSALEDGYVGPYNIPGSMPPRTIQVFWHMDWNLDTRYTLFASRLPTYNAFPESPFIKQPLPDLTINEDEVASGVLNLTDYFGDPDSIQGDRLTYTFTASGQQNIAVQVVNGLVSVIPSANWSGTNLFSVRARDTTGSSVSMFWNITVSPVNDLPYLATSAPVRFSEDGGVQVLNLYDYVRDVDLDTLTFTQVPDTNLTLTFTDTSIRVQSAPDFQTTSLGADYPVYFDVGDGQSPPVRMAIYVNVTNTLDAPRALMLTTTVSCDEDTVCPTVDLYSVFYDPDDPLRRAPLNFLVSSNGEIGYTIAAGRTLMLNLPADYSGAKTIQLQAVKFVGGQPYSSEIVDLSLLVAEVNDPPRVNTVTPGPVTVQEGGSKSFTIDAADPEHLPLTYDWFLDGVNQQNTLSTFAYAPGFNVAHAGGSQVVHLRVVANDSQGGLAEFEWEVTVVDVPHAPLVSISAPMEGNRGYHVGVPLTFFASAFDPDGDVLSYEWKDSGGQILLTTANGTYIFKDPGTQKITLKVSDGIISVTTSVNVTVDPAPPPPGLFQPGFEAPALIGALAVAAAVAVLARRRRGA